MQGSFLSSARMREGVPVRGDPQSRHRRASLAGERKRRAPEQWSDRRERGSSLNLPRDLCSILRHASN